MHLWTPRFPSFEASNLKLVHVCSYNDHAHPSDDESAEGGIVAWSNSGDKSKWENETVQGGVECGTIRSRAMGVDVSRASFAVDGQA